MSDGMLADPYRAALKTAEWTWAQVWRVLELVLRSDAMHTTAIKATISP